MDVEFHEIPETPQLISQWNLEVGKKLGWGILIFGLPECAKHNLGAFHAWS